MGHAENDAINQTTSNEVMILAKHWDKIVDA